MAGLVAAGVAGLWQLSTSVARLDERLGNWITVSEHLFNQVARDTRVADRRLVAIRGTLFGCQLGLRKARLRAAETLLK